MKKERWNRLKDLFERSVELPAEARGTFLGEACGEDVDLRQEVEALLGSHDSAGAFLETPAAAAYVAATAGRAEDLVGRRIGSFTIVAEVGRGGMGAVYRARRVDAEYVQDVALKIVQAGLVSAQFNARFRQERRILATLEHPNIARLIDGGNTDDGRPYFAMEFVDGQPIDKYCDERALGLRARLELFRTVCDAVAYASRKLIVHRDLKPTNIMVTSDGSPKLLDFGIAKLLSGEEAEQSGLTQTGFGVMTPEYASPEQVRGEPITTSTDVYALGLLLYLLLTGRKAYELTSSNAEETARVICHEEPRPPSHVARAAGGWRVPADVDTIVLKALRKEPDRRYASAAELSEDVRRYLVGLPVRARPDAIGYTMSRFVSRHRAVVGAAALAFLFLAGGLVATIYQARVADANRLRAEKRFQDVRRIANSLVFELNDSIADIPGATKARALLLKRASDLLDTLAADAPNDPILAEEVATAYHRLGGVLHSGGESSLGEREAAIEAHRKGLAIREQRARAAPEDADAQERLASSHISVSYLLPDGQEVWTHVRAAVAIAGAIAAAHPDNPAYQRRLGNARFAEAAHLASLGRIDEAIAAFQHVAAVYEGLLARQPDDAALIRNAALAHKRLGAILTRAGRLPEALDHYRKAVHADEGRLARDPASIQARYDLSVSLTDLGIAMGASGDFTGQIEQCTKALALREQLGRTDRDNAQVRQGIVSVLVVLGRASGALGRNADALSFLNRALAISQPLAKDGDVNSGLSGALAQVHRNLGHWQEAARWSKLAVDSAGRAAARNPANAWQRVDVAWAQIGYGDILAQRASLRGRDPELAARDWMAAAAAYHAADAEAAALKEHGALVGRDTALPERARSGLARCQQALSKRSRRRAT